MTNISITESGTLEDNLSYIQSAAGELFIHAGCSSRLYHTGGRAILNVNCPVDYADVVVAEIKDKVAEIIAIKYKYDFFKSTLSVGGLKSVEKEILFASLIAADLDDDKKYAFDKIKNSQEIAVDGLFNFRLKLLKKKWQEVAECIPQCFLNTQLKEFITYLTENKKKRVYVDGETVYDSHYRRLKRTSLLGGENAKIVREVLLSNCGEVELNGQIPQEDEFYLKEYYCDKIFFTRAGNGNCLN